MEKLPKQQQKKISLIRKANNFIEARYKFDIWETRIFFSVLSKIKRDDTDFRKHRIYYKDIIQTFSLKPTSSYELLRVAAESLLDKKVVVNNDNRETIYNLFGSVDVLKEEAINNITDIRNDYVDIVINEQMRELLLQLQKNFTSYDLRNIVNLGVYPIRMYELLKQYEKIGQRLLYIEEIKQMFELENEYPRYSNFYQRIIKPAIQEIEKHTDLTITKLEKIKGGGKTIALRFFFKGKTDEAIAKVREETKKSSKYPTQQTLFESFHNIEDIEEEYDDFEEIEQENSIEAENITQDNQNEQETLYNEFEQIVVKEFGVSPFTFMKLIQDYDVERIRTQIRITQNKLKTGKVKSGAGFFVEAVKNNYFDQSEVEQKQKERKAKERELNEEKIKILQENISDIDKLNIGAINDRIREVVANNPNLREEAMQNIIDNHYNKLSIMSAEKKLQRSLTIQDFREEEDLLVLMKKQIVELHKEEFEDILKELEKERKILVRHIRELEK